MFTLLPVATCCHKVFIQKQSFSSVYDAREVMVGGGFLIGALIFFLLGLDDPNDPYRIFHGAWHVCGSFASLRLWRSVKDPVANVWVKAEESL